MSSFEALQLQAANHGMELITHHPGNQENRGEVCSGSVSLSRASCQRESEQFQKDSFVGADLLDTECWHCFVCFYHPTSYELVVATLAFCCKHCCACKQKELLADPDLVNGEQIELNIAFLSTIYVWIKKKRHNLGKSLFFYGSTGLVKYYLIYSCSCSIDSVASLMSLKHFI